MRVAGLSVSMEASWLSILHKYPPNKSFNSFPSSKARYYSSSARRYELYIIRTTRGGGGGQEKRRPSFRRRRVIWLASRTDDRSFTSVPSSSPAPNHRRRTIRGTSAPDFTISRSAGAIIREQFPNYLAGPAKSRATRDIGACPALYCSSA